MSNRLSTQTREVLLALRIVGCYFRYRFRLIQMNFYPMMSRSGACGRKDWRSRPTHRRARSTAGSRIERCERCVVGELFPSFVADIHNLRVTPCTRPVRSTSNASPRILLARPSTCQIKQPSHASRPCMLSWGCHSAIVRRCVCDSTGRDHIQMWTSGPSGSLGHPTSKNEIAFHATIDIY